MLVVHGKEILLEKIVSKKTKLKDLFIANYLNIDNKYLIDKQEINLEKEIIEIIPKEKLNLSEIIIIIEKIPNDLELRRELYYNPILKALEKPFRILVFNPKEFNIIIKSYSETFIKKIKLDNFSGIYSAYCNSFSHLYISGGENKGKGKNYFWGINKQHFNIKRLKNLRYNKESHTMFFVPKKYIFFIGGNTNETFFYNIHMDNFEDWGPLNKKRIKPCIALVNKSHLYVFDSQQNNKDSEFIEKSNLIKGRVWELLKIVLEERFPMTNFCAAVDYDNNVYLFGGKTKNKELSFLFDSKVKSLTPFEQENSIIVSSDKRFYPIDRYHSALIPNLESDNDNICVIVFNTRIKRFKRIKYNFETEEIIVYKNIESKNQNTYEEKVNGAQ